MDAMAVGACRRAELTKVPRIEFRQIPIHPANPVGLWLRVGMHAEILYTNGRIARYVSLVTLTLALSHFVGEGC